MRVALLNDQLEAGGAERVLVNMANLLHKNGFFVKVILFLEPAVLDHLLHPDIPVLYLHRKGRFDVKAMKALKEGLADVDIAHIHSRYNLRYYYTARLLTGFRSVKTVFHEHIPILSIDFFTRLFFRKSDAYVAVVKSMCDWAINVVSLPAAKVFYLPNSINPPASAIQQQSAGPKIVMVGNYWHFKNQLFAIRLMSELPPEYTLDIYGAINDQNYYESMVKLIDEYGLKARVKMVQGVSDLYTVLANYNFAIHTSPQETGPLVLLEYMHAGLPFLTFKTGDVVANIQQHLPQLILEDFEISSWKNAIMEVMGNEEMRKTVRTKMQALIAEKYSEERYLHQLELIYKSIAN